MKRVGIWESQVRWQNGHYQSVKQKEEISNINYRLVDNDVAINYTLIETPSQEGLTFSLKKPLSDSLTFSLKEE